MLKKSRTKQIGTFKHFVEVQKEELTPDGMGGQTVSWVKHAELWANIKPVSGNQRLQLDATQSTVSHIIQTRDEYIITNEYRIKYGTRKFNIHYELDQDEENTFREMAATELK